MRYLTALAVSAVSVLALAACGSSTPSSFSPGPPPSAQPPSPPPSPTSQPPSPPPSPTSQPQSSSDAVTGTVTWPDGKPAVSASVYFNNHETGFSGSGWSQHDSANSWYRQQLPADGSYSLPGCPCADLTAYLFVPSAVMSPANGGWDCWIIMQDDNKTYSGRQANPGDIINWQGLDLACSPTFYTSDPPTVQSQSTAVSSGSWQTAEQLTSGGGSG